MDTVSNMHALEGMENRVLVHLTTATARLAAHSLRAVAMQHAREPDPGGWIRFGCHGGSTRVGSTLIGLESRRSVLMEEDGWLGGCSYGSRDLTLPRLTGAHVPVAMDTHTLTTRHVPLAPSLPT